MQKKPTQPLGRTTSAIVHDLRNPLAAINNSVYFVKTKLTSRALDPKIIKHLEIIQSEITRAGDLITDILIAAQTQELVPFLKYTLAGQALTREQAYHALNVIMNGSATPAQVGALLGSMCARGETVAELVGFAQALRVRMHAARVRRVPLLDTCGTGGDGTGTFNISTTVAFIAAGAGACVAKHGNRAVSSRCGSADVLEALGVKTSISPDAAASILEKTGISFFFAPAHHPAFAAAASVRRELGTRTIFNLLGPLVNPARAKRQLLGVYAIELIEPMANALRALGSQEALVVSSRDGLDEMSLGAPTVVGHVRRGRVRVYEIDPRDFGLRRRPLSALAGGDAKRNAEILLSVLRGELGAPRDVCLLNAAAALMAAGIARNFKDGLTRAARSIDTGAALCALKALVQASA